MSVVGCGLGSGNRLGMDGWVGGDVAMGAVHGLLVGDTVGIVLGWNRYWSLWGKRQLVLWLVTSSALSSCMLVYHCVNR